MMKSLKIIRDAWTGSLFDFVIGSLWTALYVLAIITIFFLGGML